MCVCVYIYVCTHTHTCAKSWLWRKWKWNYKAKRNQRIFYRGRNSGPKEAGWLAIDPAIWGQTAPAVHPLLTLAFPLTAVSNLSTYWAGLHRMQAERSFVLSSTLSPNCLSGLLFSPWMETREGPVALSIPLSGNNSLTWVFFKSLLFIVQISKSYLI